MTKMIDLRSQLVNTPLLMTQEQAESFAALDPDSFMIEDHSLSEGDGMNFFVAGPNESRIYRIVDGVAVIPVQGALMHRLNWSGWGITGYGYIRSAFDMALADPEVKGIAFDVKSGGGDVNGAFELAEHIRKNRDVKPSMAVLDTFAYSAAYLLGSAAGSMSVPQTGGAGSIGVVTMHTDYSKAMNDAGVKITFIHAGKHKVDGNPYAALPDTVRDRIQTRVDHSYSMFVDAVSEQRGLSTEEVKATEAQTFSAQEALDLGLVDVIASPEEALASFVAALNGRNEKEDIAMSTSDNAQAASQATEGAITQAQLDVAVQTAKTEERERFASVLACDDFHGREALATKMLGETEMSAEQIIGMLALTPAEKAEVETTEDQGSSTNAFEDAMSSTENPEVGASAAASGEPSDEDLANQILADAGFITE